MSGTSFPLPSDPSPIFILYLPHCIFVLYRVFPSLLAHRRVREARLPRGHNKPPSFATVCLRRVAIRVYSNQRAVVVVVVVFILVLCCCYRYSRPRSFLSTCRAGNTRFLLMHYFSRVDTWRAAVRVRDIRGDKSAILSPMWSFE